MSRLRRRDRARAVLTGALVLGIGGAMTLASWTDQVNASGAFGTSRFDVVGNVTSPYDVNGTWADYATTGTAGTLTFTAGALSLAPGDAVYAPFALRTATGSVAANVTVNGATTTGSSVLATALRYRLVQSAATCAVGAFSSPTQWLIGQSGAAALTTVGTTGALTLAAATVSTPGTAKQLCFEISLPDTPANQSSSALQGVTTTATWNFAATS